MLAAWEIVVGGVRDERASAWGGGAKCVVEGTQGEIRVGGERPVLSWCYEKLCSTPACSFRPLLMEESRT